MTSLTVDIEEDLLERVRLWAVERGISINALVRDSLDAYIGDAAERREAVRRLIERGKGTPSAGSGGRRWTRDELHER